MVAIDLTGKEIFQKAFADIALKAESCPDEELISVMKSLAQLIEKTPKSWILERNYNDVAIHQANVCFAIMNTNHLCLFLAGIEILEAIVQSCFRHFTTLQDEGFMLLERCTSEIVKFIVFDSIWSTRAQLLKKLIAILQRLDKFSLAILPSITTVFKESQVNTPNSSIEFTSSVSLMLDILHFYNKDWHALLNRHLDIIMPMLADLIAIKVVNKEEYFVFSDLDNYNDIHSAISDIYQF